MLKTFSICSFLLAVSGCLGVLSFFPNTYIFPLDFLVFFFDFFFSFRSPVSTAGDLLTVGEHNI